MNATSHDFHRGLRSIAIFEAAKGTIVLLAGIGFLEAGDQIIEHLELPARHVPRIFLDALEKAQSWDLRWLAVGTALYSLFRFVEAYGLWKDRSWAEWVAIVSCAAYLPMEALGILRHFTWIKLTITVFNIALLAYLIWVRRQKAALRLSTR